jgi:hypothetical protein
MVTHDLGVVTQNGHIVETISSNNLANHGAL